MFILWWTSVCQSTFYKKHYLQNSKTRYLYYLKDNIFWYERDQAVDNVWTHQNLLQAIIITLSLNGFLLQSWNNFLRGGDSFVKLSWVVC